MKIKVLTETTEGRPLGICGHKRCYTAKESQLRHCLLMQRSGCCERVQTPSQCLTHLKNDLIAKLKVVEEMSRYAA